MYKITLICSSFFLFLACNPQEPKENGEGNNAVLEHEIDNKLDSIHSSGAIQGFGVAVVNANGALYQKGFGTADKTMGKPYSINTLQNIASVSKTMIGIALLKAQEMGKLELEDPVNQYLPFKVENPYYPSEDITIKHLATHTSSITDGDLYGEKSYLLKNASDLEMAQANPGTDYFNLPEEEVSMEAFLQNFLSPEGEWFQKESYLNQKPGTLYEYTNVGATLAALIIEKVTGQSYAEFTSQHILQTLGMNASGWGFASVNMAEHSKLFSVEGEDLPFYSLITYPDGGLITSIQDMSKYLSELIKAQAGEGTLLTKESYEQIFSPLLTDENFEERDTDNPFDDEYNSGIFMGYTPAGFIGHMGGDPGVSTFLFFDPKTKIGKLLFVNTDLDEKGAQQFYAIWDVLSAYETKLSAQ